MKKNRLMRCLLLWITTLTTSVVMGQLTYPQLTSIPTIYIDTDNKAAITSKDTYIAGRVNIVSSDESECITDSVINIRGRGNSTWTSMPKKAYRIKFTKKTRLLGQNAKLKNWVLLANYADKSLMRNGLAFEMSRYIGMDFSPAARFVDVVLNGKYIGNYMLTDQVEVNKNRVPVTEQLPIDIAEPDITGGYLIELDGFAAGEPVWFQTARGIKVTIKSPKNDEINQQQRNYITQYTKDYESLLFSSQYTDPDKGYRAQTDTPSLINWYIACELTGNSDAFWSVYMYKERGEDKFHYGPLWDFDIAFNNDDRLGDATRKLMREHAHNPKIWIQRIWTDAWFRHAVNQRWQELVESGIESYLHAYIDRTAAEINASQSKNFSTWNILNTKVYREQYVFKTYAENVSYLKRYISSRILFLTDSFAKEDDTPTPLEPFVAEEYYYRIMNIRTNNVVDITDQSTSKNALLMLWNPIEDRESQHWRIEKVKEGQFMFISRHSELAVKGNGRGNNLIQVTPNAADARQLWNITTVAKGQYGIINVDSKYSINNNGGSFDNGNKVIEWDERITESQNQQWYLEKVEAIATRVPFYLSRPQPTGYFIDTHFVLEDWPEWDEVLKDISIYTTSGVCLIKEQTRDNNIDVSDIPEGVYIVVVQAEGQVVTMKCRKR